MPDLISDFQGAFIQEKKILAGVLIANECVDSRLKANKPGILCKIDMEKAFDNVNCHSLFTILEKHDFGAKWISWIKWCVTSSHLSILVNGSSTEKLKPSKGLRQGDSLSPYIFLLVVEVLSKLITDVVERGQLTGFQVVENGTIISLLHFADDTLIFLDASVEEVRRLFIILAVFESITGIKLNLDKSTMISVGAEAVIEALSKEIGCKTEKLPFKYLGIPIGEHWRSTTVWEYVLTRMEQRLASWKKRTLNKVVSKLVEVNLVLVIQDLMVFTMKNGRGIRFWKDNWTQRGRLQDIFPVSFKATRDKKSSIVEIIVNGSWTCNFKRRLNANESLEWDLLCRDIPVPTLEDGEDEVSFILWDSFHDSLPTRDMFSHRAFKISWPMPRTLLQLFDAWDMNVLHGKGKAIWKIIHYTVCWILWKERNGRVFGGRRKDTNDIINLVKQLVVLWSFEIDTFKFVPPSLIWSNWEELMSE
ncbi:uncharacterized protein LOC113339485 [Papaver somniferum]|uniref:uncharacterized protein LOC113339485 n=1 Tax=Papaver somniferum TaxID=3469 RepID=UPI000E702AB1|nr:uncharacterized protein LOC113339485 [Papaver somniferum]